MTSPRWATPAVLSGLAACSVGLAITFTLAARHGWDEFIDYDAVFFRSVASNLDPSHVHGDVTAFRYGRVGLPLLARILALGAPSALTATQMLVTPLAFGALVAAAVSMAGRLSGRWWHGLVVVAVPGVWVGAVNALADTLLAACLVVSIWATLEDRRWACVVAIALAALTKEVGVLCAVPPVAAALVAGRPRWALERALALGPAVLWWSWVRLQAGEWPALADDPSRAGAISPPLVDVVHAMTGGRGAPIAALFSLLLGGLGLNVAVRHRRSPLAWSAGFWSVLTLSFGDNVLFYIGDTLRVATPATAVVLLAVVLLDHERSRARERPATSVDGA